ncbi:hypothetical protein T484DRAFT_1799553 [Baffinella frigidus]|nr:hypothetical protein T484DRAFT_1799553 [Cryptophyta sp. CCMP2293]
MDSHAESASMMRMRRSDDTTTCRTRRAVRQVVVSSDLRMRIIDADSAWLSLFKFQLEDVKGKSLRIVEGPDPQMFQLEDVKGKFLRTVGRA